jgi:hypothetical protein
MLWLVVAATAALLWLALKEKPQYRKAYFRTRSDGVFKTDYSPGFREYLEAIDKEVPARSIRLTTLQRKACVPDTSLVTYSSG